jgi:hypothetical protein
MTIESRGGYLIGSGLDHEGWHVEYQDFTCRLSYQRVHLVFDTEDQAREFIIREFPGPTDRSNYNSCPGDVAARDSF